MACAQKFCCFFVAGIAAAKMLLFLRKLAAMNILTKRGRAPPAVVVTRFAELADCMPDSSGYERFTDLLKLTDRMISDAPKSAIAEAARMLAIQVGHYQRKFGVLPFEEAIVLLESETLSDEQAGWIADGLENLAVAIASVKDDDAPLTVQ